MVKNKYRKNFEAEFGSAGLAFFETMMTICIIMLLVMIVLKVLGY